MRNEAATARQSIFTVWSRPIGQRVARGRAIEGVRILGVKPNGFIHLECGHNSSRFREGDILCLNRGNPFADPHLMVTLEVDDESSLVVALTELGPEWEELLRQHSGWVLDEGYLDLSGLILGALDEVGDTTVGRERILPLLMGAARPRVDVARYERGLAYAEANGLNWSQSEALANAYTTDLTYLIQGPPGTGKTRVLAHLAQALVEDGERVLITAFTHRAIDNALNKLADVAPDISAFKIGQ
ncbi:MAG TPA: hypothetical protein DEP84_21745 [Chloroflexi bacterium]|nr:hypothetical protein [Chloroflexota bacterium]